MGLEVVYKVLFRRQTGDLVSGGLCYGIHALVYRLNEKTVPAVKDSKLFAFKELEDAFSWGQSLDLGSALAIYYCHAENVQPAKSMCHPKRLDTYIEAFWKDAPLPNGTLLTPPKGTVFCDRIILLQLVEDFSRA